MAGLHILVLLSAIFASTLCDFQIERADTSSLDRPCDFDDLDCISDIFIDSGWCPPGDTTDSTPFQVPYVRTRAAALNATAEDVDLVFSGLENGVIKEFYVNPETDAALLSITFENVNIETNSNYIFHHRYSEDLRVIIPDTVALYPSITLRILSHGDNKFQPGTTNIFTNVEVIPEYEFPGAENVTDPEVLFYLSEISKNIDLVIQELFVERGKLMYLYFVRNIICNNDDN